MSCRVPAAFLLMGIIIVASLDAVASRKNSIVNHRSGSSGGGGSSVAPAGAAELWGSSETASSGRRRSGTVVVGPGSRLPDCSHACGSCSPCHLVMVSVFCASLAESETCPMTYKCMCRTKSYPVP